MLTIEVPSFGLFTICEIMEIIEKHSMPHVSGIQIESGLHLDKILEHSIISFIESKEPKLNAILKKITLLTGNDYILQISYHQHILQYLYVNLLNAKICECTL